MHTRPRTLRTLRCAGILGALVVALALVPAAQAGVRVGFNVNIALPAGVHVSVGNYEPYYVGRVFYQPLGVWRPVYSFPVATAYGVVYRPYVYDGGRVVCRDYIPGRGAGYGEFIHEGRGRYDAKWRHDRYEVRNHRHDHQDHASNRHYGNANRNWNKGRKHDDRRDSRGQGKGNNGRGRH